MERNMKSATSQRTIFSSNRSEPFAAVLATFLLASAIASAQTGTVLYSFNGTTDGKTPYGGVVLDSAGNLYGTTFEGGDTCYSLLYSCGVVFKLTPSGTETLVHPFVGSGKPGLHDGDWPWAGLVMDKKGNLYGTTSSGGSSNAGTVFKVGPTGKETVLYSFKAYGDGNEPQDSLILDSEGNLYGTTFYGGTGTGCGNGVGGCGTVFEVTQAGTETVLYSFGGGNDGNFPTSGLVRDAEGNLYGTTYYGGLANANYCPIGCGTVFKLSSTGIKTTLYSFTGNADGGSPQGSLLLDAHGNLYGVTVGGGTFGPGCGDGCGTVFKVTAAGTETVIHSFTGGTDGVNPYSGLIRDAKGNFYGTTRDGGSMGAGTVYKLTPAGQETILYDFPGSSNGSSPWSGLVMDAKGNLYGTTAYGGAYSYGTVFEVTP
jgi:uncharacterized repeat protein (TIGR03803 family)